MIKKSDEKEALEFKKIYKQYIDKRSEIKKNSQFKIEDIFGNVIRKDSTSQEQITKPNNFSAKIMRIKILV